MKYGHKPGKKIHSTPIVDFPKDFIKILAIFGKILVVVVTSLGGAEVARENVGAGFDHQRFEVDLCSVAIS